MSKLKLTVDGNADQKILRKLAAKGYVELHAINIESMLDNKKIKHKDLPLAVYGSPHSTYGNSVYAADDTIYPTISKAMTRDNHGDALQLEGHIRSGRDVLVSDDKDFLARREELLNKFGAVIKSTEEIVAMFDLGDQTDP